MAATLLTVGNTTGRPSVQPRANSISWSSLSLAPSNRSDAGFGTALLASLVRRSTSASTAASARSVTVWCCAVCIGCGTFTSGSSSMPRPGRLLARGFGKGGAEHVDGRNAAPFDLDGVRDIDRGRGAAIAEAQHHRVALRKTRQVGVAQTILRRKLAHDRTGHDRKAVAELAAQPLDEEIGIALAVVDEADALAAQVRQAPGAGNRRRTIRNGGFQQFQRHQAISVAAMDIIGSNIIQLSTRRQTRSWPWHKRSTGLLRLPH